MIIVVNIPTHAELFQDNHCRRIQKIFAFSLPNERGGLLLDGYLQNEPVESEPFEVNIIEARGVAEE